MPHRFAQGVQVDVNQSQICCGKWYDDVFQFSSIGFQEFVKLLPSDSEKQEGISFVDASGEIHDMFWEGGVGYQDAEFQTSPVKPAILSVRKRVI